MTTKMRNKTTAKAETSTDKKMVARKAAKPSQSLRHTTSRPAIDFEPDDSPTAKAIMKAYRITHEQLWGAKSERAKK